MIPCDAVLFARSFARSLACSLDRSLAVTPLKTATLRRIVAKMYRPVTMTKLAKKYAVKPQGDPHEPAIKSVVVRAWTMQRKIGATPGSPGATPTPPVAESGAASPKGPAAVQASGMVRKVGPAPAPPSAATPATPVAESGAASPRSLA